MIAYTTIPVGMLESNCYILNDNGALALVDCGIFTRRVREAIAEQGGDLRYILLTHSHFDHVQGVASAKAAYPQAQVCIGEGDIPSLKKPFPVDLALKDGDLISLGNSTLRVISTPGHTRGGVCYLAGTERLLFTGDTLFREEVGRDDLPGGDWPTLVASIRRLYDIPEDYIVLPGHFQASTLGHERRHNPYVKMQ